MGDDLHVAVGERLRRAGLRYSRSRRAVVEVLATSRRPLTLPEMLSRREALAQSSAYRNLAELERAGVVRSIATGAEFRHFELAEDLTGDHHDHLVCHACGTIVDYTPEPELESVLAQLATRAAGSSGFTIDGHRLDLVGRCASCA